jgi:hypothetical protein
MGNGKEDVRREETRRGEAGSEWGATTREMSHTRQDEKSREDNEKGGER